MGTALITGASYGIGEALARALAKRGYDLVLTARSRARLEALATELRQAGRRVTVYCADLERPDAPREVLDFVHGEGIELDLLVNNAGFSAVGNFEEIPLEKDIGMLDVNVKALVALSYLELPRMLARGSGTIINVASTAGFQPVPFMTTYAATKAFVLSLSIGLWREYRDRGVHVMAVCPGTTRTNFFNAAGFQPRSWRFSQSAEEVVRATLKGLDRRRPLVVSGWYNRLMVFTERVAPRMFVVDRAADYMKSQNLPDR